jgi:hypothetical protein
VTSKGRGRIRAAIDCDLWASERISLDHLRTVCLLLGPYRNLSTLTASMMFLHPRCQVLNHASVRVFGNRQIDFLSGYNKNTFDAFVRYAVHISQSGKGGQRGGTITRSHAFKNPSNPLGRIYAERFGERLVKEQIRSVLWKEPLRVSNHLRLHGGPGPLVAQNNLVRFLLPIRNPLDCAASNLKTGHSRLFIGLSPEPSIEDILAAVLGEILWFVEWETRIPDRFFHFCANRFDRDTVERLARFMELDPIDTWCSDALQAFQLKSGYKHEPTLVDFYRETVERKFLPYPELARDLLSYAQTS